MIGQCPGFVGGAVTQPCSTRGPRLVRLGKCIERNVGHGLVGALFEHRFRLRLTGLALFRVLLTNIGLVVSEFTDIGASIEVVGIRRHVRQAAGDPQPGDGNRADTATAPRAT